MPKLLEHEELCWFLCKYANQNYAEVVGWPITRIRRGVKAVYKLYEREDAALQAELKKNKR